MQSVHSYSTIKFSKLKRENEEAGEGNFYVPSVGEKPQGIFPSLKKNAEEGAIDMARWFKTY